MFFVLLNEPALFVVLVRFVTLVLTSYLTPSLLVLNHLLESLIILIVPHLTLFTASNVLAVIFLYIGETSRRFGDRIRDHLYDVRKNDLTKPVSRHFNLPNHSISDFIVFGLSLVSGNNDCRKTKEMRLIHRLGTHNPNGMNERFNYS